jgi:hypothetical protein
MLFKGAPVLESGTCLIDFDARQIEDLCFSFFLFLVCRVSWLCISFMEVLAGMYYQLKDVYFLV